MSLLDMSLAGGVFILAVVVIRAVGVHHLPKGTFLCLWAVALGRLLIPYALPSSLSVYTLWARLTPVAEPVRAAVAPGRALSVVPAPYVPGAAVVTVPKEAAPAAINWFVVIWLAVALALAFFFAVSHYRCYREFRASLPADNAQAKAFLVKHPLHRKVRLQVSDRITAPLTYGVVRPVILLPKGFDWTDGEGLACALCHELYHIRRFDAVTKLVLAAALCLHWFNPAVWVMYVLANRDLELSCDEAVVRQFGPDHRRTYVDALIRMEERRSRMAPLYNHFSKNAMEERIVAIMKIRKTSLAALILAVTLIVGVTVAFATTAKQPSAQETVPDQIVASLDYRSDVICFTLPEDLIQPEKLTIHVSGRAQYEDGFSRSLHFLEGETWEEGKTYTIPYDPSYTDLFLDVSYQQSQRSVDLLAAGKYGSDNPDKTTTEVQRVTSYVDRYDGKTYYSTDNGQTWQEGDPFAATGYGFDDVEWWTAEEYEAWLTEQKKEFQAMLGERSWNPTEGWYTWDQARIDAAIAGSEQLLQEIKDGKKVSKPMADGDTMIQFGYDPRAITSVAEVMDAAALSQSDPVSERSQKDLLAEYGPYGISFDSAGNMLYEGVVIGLFVDGVEVDNGGWAVRYVYQSDVGAQRLIAVRARRDNGDGSYDPFGALTGIRAMTDSEWAALSRINGAALGQEAVAVMTEDEGTVEDGSVDFRDAFNEKFKPYGVSFVPSGSFGNVYWNGQLVKVFEDKTPDGGYQTISSIDGGEISLRAVYGAGGKLTGVAQSAASETLRWPLPADKTEVSNAVGTKVDPISGQAIQHDGIDIAAPEGTPVYAAHSGEVTTAEFQSKYGNYIVLDRGDGVRTLYAHLSKLTVSAGDKVESGQAIGAVGSSGQATGPHLHIALYQDGMAQDPMAYFSQS